MRTGTRRESWRKKKNDDELLMSTFQLLNGTEMGKLLTKKLLAAITRVNIIKCSITKLMRIASNFESNLS